MPVFKNRAASTTTTTGTGPFTLSAVAIALYQTIDAAFTVGEAFDGYIEDAASGLWMCGNFTLSAANTLTVNTVYTGSNGAGVAVNFTAGTKRITASVSAETLNKLLTTDTVQTLTANKDEAYTALAAGATVTPDASKPRMSLTPNTAGWTLAAPANPPAVGVGRSFMIAIENGATAYEISLATIYKQRGGGVVPSINVANAKYNMYCNYLPNGDIEYSLSVVA